MLELHSALDYNFAPARRGAFLFQGLFDNCIFLFTFLSVKLTADPESFLIGDDIVGEIVCALARVQGTLALKISHVVLVTFMVGG